MDSTSTSSPQNELLQSHLRLHLIVFIWGFTAILGDLISLSATSLVWYRIGISLFFMWPFVWIFRRGNPVPNRTKILLMLTGIIIGLHWITFFHAIKISNVSITLACISSGSLFTALIEPLFFKRKIIGYEIVLGGLVVIGISTIFAVETQYAAGILVALASAALSALFSVINGLWVRTHKPTVISSWELTGGFLAIGVFLFLMGRMSTPGFFSVSSMDWLYLLILGSICTAYPFIESVRIMRHISPFTVMLTVNLEPVYGILLALAMFGDKEHMSPGFYVGAVMILVAVFANGYLARRRRLKKPLAQ